MPSKSISMKGILKSEGVARNLISILCLRAFSRAPALVKQTPKTKKVTTELRKSGVVKLV